jgi:hypothetical protein
MFVISALQQREESGRNCHFRTDRDDHHPRWVIMTYNLASLGLLLKTGRMKKLFGRLLLGRMRGDDSEIS